MARDTFPLKVAGIVVAVLLVVGVGIAAAVMLLGGDEQETEQVAISQEDLNELDAQLNDALADDGETDPVVDEDDDVDVVATEPATTDDDIVAAPEGTTATAPSRPTPTASASSATGDATSHNAAGLRLFEQGDYTAALERFARARESAPRDPHVLNNHAWTLHKLNRHAEAARELEAVLELDRDREIAYANLGEVLLAQGDREGAITAYERFLELNDNPAREDVARRKLEQIRAGE